MSNSCKNELTIRGKNGVLACLEAIKGVPDKYSPHHIDFQKIVPMPPILRKTMVGCFAWEAFVSEEEFDSLGDYDPPLEELRRRKEECKRETGCHDWYEWRLGTVEQLYEDGHWGTKWNAWNFGPIDNASDTRATITFETPNSPPTPIIIELSRQYPRLTFTLKFWAAYRDVRGILRVKGGKVQKRETYEYLGSTGRG